MESVDSHVVVARKHVDRYVGHLHVDIRVPGHDLCDNVRELLARWLGRADFAIPPPAQERAVYDPCFCPYV